MHNILLNLFKLLKNCIQILKLLILFCIMMFLLYWVQNLVNANWTWLGFIKPLLLKFIHIGNYIAMSFSFEKTNLRFVSYFITLLIYIGLYFSCNILTSIVDFIQAKYMVLHNKINKIQEDRFNNAMAKKHSEEMAKIKKYSIFVSAEIKKEFLSEYNKIDLTEQYEIMNKFLSGKTGIIPQNFENGFLYTFNDFNEIDSILPYFFKLIKSKAPLNYTICVQVYDSNTYNNTQQLQLLSSLGLINKIVTFADTAYRYKFNKDNKYEIVQIGLFQKNNKTLEAMEFTEI